MTNAQLQELHEQAFELRISHLSDKERQAEREKRADDLRCRQEIYDANERILWKNKAKPTDEERYNTRVMRRELELMMYNMSPDELKLYRGYTKKYVGTNDYLFKSDEDHPSCYEPSEKKVYCDFRLMEDYEKALFTGFDYTPRFNWGCRIHEEGHHMDDCFGKNGLKFSHPDNEGKEFLEALNNDALAFINIVRQDQGLAPVKDLKNDRKTDIAILDFLLDNYPDCSAAAGDMIDNLGTCSHGETESGSIHNWQIFMSVVYGGLTILGHKHDYNIQDLEGGKHILRCDETSEGFAEFMARHWLISNHAIDFCNKYMNSSTAAAKAILDKMVLRANVPGFTW